MRRVQLDEELGWRLLLDVTRIERINPWRIDLVKLLRELEEEVSSSKLSLVLAGVAIYSASFIHRMKSEKLLKSDEPPEHKEKPNLIVPPPIEVPIKSNVLLATLLDVVNSLKTILMSMSTKTEESRFEQINIDIKIDDYLLKIEEQVEEFISFLESLLASREFIKFSELIEGVDRLEATRRFILMLFAASRGRIELYQDDENAEIVIMRRSMINAA